MAPPLSGAAVVTAAGEPPVPPGHVRTAWMIPEVHSKPEQLLRRPRRHDVFPLWRTCEGIPAPLLLSLCAV